MAFSLNETIILSAINGGGLLSLVDGVMSPGYGIYYSSDGALALKPSSVLSIDFKNDSSIVDSPIEGGSYSSYNKVKHPSTIKVTFVLEGWTGYSGAIPNLTNFSLTSRTDMLQMLDLMVASSKLYDIDTPDTTYEQYDLLSYNYVTEAKDVTLLKVEAVFQAVQENAGVTFSGTTEKKVNATASNSTINDVNAALSGLNCAIADASAPISDYAFSAVSKATGTITGSENGYKQSSMDDCSLSISKLVAGLT